MLEPVVAKDAKAKARQIDCGPKLDEVLSLAGSAIDLSGKVLAAPEGYALGAVRGVRVLVKGDAKEGFVYAVHIGTNTFEASTYRMQGNNVVFGSQGTDTLELRVESAHSFSYQAHHRH
jgi:hypothetical protein